MSTLSTFTQNLVSHGKYFFTKQEAQAALGLNKNQFRYQAYRLSLKKSILRLVRDFYMIIPAEYRAFGSLPSHWIVDPLMRYMDRSYYIGLLSAASLYGATEQQPMTFQVIVNKVTRRITLPRGTIEFHVKHNCQQSEIDSISTPTGYAHISTREQTMVDLVGYYAVSGGLSNVALVIQDLGAECDIKALECVVSKEENTAILQRLGYLLQLTHHPLLACAVERELAQRHCFFIPLRPDVHKRTGERISRWKIILNDYVELA
jgi:predicted transcriptional regulator of viral defense system